MELEVAKDIGGQAQLGGNYAVDVVLRALEHTDGLWVEGYTRDTLKVDAPPGSRFLGWLLYDREGGHYKAVQYSGGSFFLLDSLNRQPKKLTAGEAEDELGAGAGKQRDGRRHFRVFCLEGATLDPPQGPPAQSSSRRQPPFRKTDAHPYRNPENPHALPRDARRLPKPGGLPRSHASGRGDALPALRTQRHCLRVGGKWWGRQG